MAYTPSTTLTITEPTGYTPSTTLTVSTDSGSETLTLTVPLSVSVYEEVSLTVPLSVAVFEEVTLSVPLSLSIVDTYDFVVPVTLDVRDRLTLTVPVSLDIQDKYHLTTPISLAVFEQYDLNVPLSFELRDRYALTLPIDLEVFTDATPYTLDIPISVQVVGQKYKLRVPLAVRGFQQYPLTVPVSVAVRPPSLTLSVPITQKVYDTFSLSMGVALSVYPGQTAGPGGQGVGSVVALPSDRCMQWNLKVYVDGVEVTSRLTGQITIDKERNAAVVASFSLRPADGLVDNYGWVRAPVIIWYEEKDSDDVVRLQMVIFKGIVDTPIYDSSSRVTEFTCTDNLQRVIMSLPRGAVDDLTPRAKWSKYAFDELVDSWEYLQQRIQTYPYSIGINEQGNLEVREWVPSPTLWEFEENCIIDSSLSVSLANARDIVNVVNVSMEYQYDAFRETVLSLHWQEENWYLGREMVWLFCYVQMICDAVGSSGGVFVDDPFFNTIPSSRSMISGGVSINFINDGTELLALEFKSAISKRYTQSVVNKVNVQLIAPLSVQQVGQNPGEVSGSLNVTYPSYLADNFTLTESKTRWGLSAGSGLSDGFESAEHTYHDQLIFNGTGWSPYPKLPYTYTTYKRGESNAISYSDKEMFPLPDASGSGLASFSDATAGSFKAPGEHFYDMDEFAQEGTLDQRNELLDVLIAQGTTQILESHRQNTIAFSTYFNPRVKRADPVRVFTPTLVATGLVNQIIHKFDIDRGTALTDFTLSASSTKSIGLPDEGIETVRITMPIVVSVVDKHTEDRGLRTASEFVKGGLNYTVTLGNHYHDGDTDEGWDGHVSPADYTLNSNPHEFVVNFPTLPEENTQNATLNTQLAAQAIAVPQDELFIIA